jgi:drug/metabolite transporter (DMT)-like permease
MKTNKPLWLLVAPVIFLLLWSGGFSVAKLGLKHSDPLSFLALRYTTVLLVLAPFQLILRPPYPRRRVQWLHLFIVGFLIQTVYFSLTFIALKNGVSAGAVAIIVCLQPILVGLIAPSFVSEKVSRLRWAGLGLGLAGAATVILSRAQIEIQNPLGVLAAVGGLLGITAGTLWEKRFGFNHHPIVSNGVQYVAGLIGTVPLALLYEHFSFDWSIEFIAAFAYLVLGNSIIAMTLLLAMIRAGEVSRVSSLFYLVPPMTAVIAWPMLGESMSGLGWVGFALAAAGVALSNRRTA